MMMFSFFASLVAGTSLSAVAGRILSFIRPFLLPLAGVVAIVMAYHVGSWNGAAKARGQCQEQALTAQIAELKRQMQASQTVLAMAQARADQAAQIIIELNAEADAYVAQLKSNNNCLLDNGDVERLRQLNH